VPGSFGHSQAAYINLSFRILAKANQGIDFSIPPAKAGGNS